MRCACTFIFKPYLLHGGRPQDLHSAVRVLRRKGFEWKSGIVLTTIHQEKCLKMMMRMILTHCVTHTERPELVYVTFSGDPILDSGLTIEAAYLPSVPGDIVGGKNYLETVDVLRQSFPRSEFKVHSGDKGYPPDAVRLTLKLYRL